MRSRYWVVFLLLALIMSYSLSACAQHSYDESWIIGKTSSEIEQRYGEFDRFEWGYRDDGLLHSTDAGYIIKESQVSWHGKTTEELFVVHFNEEGIADSCRLAPGNWGG